MQSTKQPDNKTTKQQNNQTTKQLNNKKNEECELIFTLEKHQANNITRILHFSFIIYDAFRWVLLIRFVIFWIYFRVQIVSWRGSVAGYVTDETYDLNRKETKRWQNVKTQKINIWRWELIEPTFNHCKRQWAGKCELLSSLPFPSPEQRQTRKDHGNWRLQQRC